MPSRLLPEAARGSEPRTWRRAGEQRRPGAGRGASGHRGAPERTRLPPPSVGWAGEGEADGTGDRPRRGEAADRPTRHGEGETPGREPKWTRLIDRILLNRLKRQEVDVRATRRLIAPSVPALDAITRKQLNPWDVAQQTHQSIASLGWLGAVCLPRGV